MIKKFALLLLNKCYNCETKVNRLTNCIEIIEEFESNVNTLFFMKF